MGVLRNRGGCRGATDGHHGHHHRRGDSTGRVRLPAWAVPPARLHARGRADAHRLRARDLVARRGWKAHGRGSHHAVRRRLHGRDAELRLRPALPQLRSWRGRWDGARDLPAHPHLDLRHGRVLRGSGAGTAEAHTGGQPGEDRGGRGGCADRERGGELALCALRAAALRQAIHAALAGDLVRRRDEHRGAGGRSGGVADQARCEGEGQLASHPGARRSARPAGQPPHAIPVAYLIVTFPHVFFPVNR